MNLEHVPEERKQIIMQTAFANRVVKIRELARKLSVHEMTVRRDLDVLTEQGILERIHGGARIAQQSASEISYGLRASQNTNSKERIAKAALALIQNGDAVGLDASTTTLALAKQLHLRRVNAVATGLDVANALATQDVPFVLTGGNFHAPARSFTGSIVRATLSKLRLDKVFFSAKGLSLSRGFTDAHLPEAESKLALIESGATVIALIDATKFEREAFCQVIGLEHIDVLVTDQKPKTKILKALEKMDIRLVIAN